MAKAKSKKSEGSPEGAAKKPAAKKSIKPTSAGPGMIDTSLAAQSAARMLAGGFNKPGGASASVKPESAMFKQMKAGLNKPHSSAMSNMLDKSQGPEQHKDHSFFKQVGHNQTFNADVTRSGVPRRTPG
jgi:hypothetical protein